MQDRFKFRFWHKPTKKMVGCYGFNPDFVFSDTFDGIGTTYNPAKFDDCILMQCTGRKDINGKLVYEKDIIRNAIHQWDRNLWLVEYNEELSCFQLKTLNLNKCDITFMNFVNSEEYEVIGNIYESGIADGNDRSASNEVDDNEVKSTTVTSLKQLQDNPELLKEQK